MGRVWTMNEHNSKKWGVTIQLQNHESWEGVDNQSQLVVVDVH